MSTPTAPAVHPVHVDAELDPRLSRGLWLVKWLLAIPHYVVLAFLWVAFAVTSLVAFFAILFTGQYPRTLFEFNVGVMRWSWRVAFYAYGALGTDRYPPFTLADVPDYPARLAVDHPDHLSRGLVLVKWWLLAIPHYVIVALLVGGLGYGVRDADRGSVLDIGLIGLLVLVAGVVLLVSGRYPKPVFDLVLGLNRWVLRVAAYVALMTDRYPPFALDQGGHEPVHPEGAPSRPAAPTADHGQLPPQPAGPPPRAQAPPSGWTAGRLVSLVLGSLLVVTGLGFAGGGLALAAADQVARDSDGFITSPRERLASDGFAVVSEDARIHVEGAASWVPSELVGDVRLSAESASDAPVFVGIARSIDARSYLAGVDHDTLLEIPGGEPVYRSTDGSAQPSAPTAEDFWVAQATGERAELTWAAEDGDWTAVVMNADGSSSVAADLRVGAEMPMIGRLVAVLLVLAALVLALGAVLVAIPVRAAGAGRPRGPA